MFTYVTVQSPKKPLAELDLELFISPGHPRGELLSRLLAAGQHSLRAYQGRELSTMGGAHGAERRVRQRDMYELARSGGIRTAIALQAWT